VMVTSPIVSCFMVSLCFPQSVLRLLPSFSSRGHRLPQPVHNRLDRRLLLVVPADATQSNAKHDKIGA
jgi:hypothetical protein